ncbi:MAG TPA: hypothetical protein VKB45_10985 [Gemmatimonadales bacterium]|nr:hypothetical protein [Gemmatimonadales bacterium]
MAVSAVLAGSVAGTAPAAAQAGQVSGRITIQEKNNAPSPDLGDAVVYLVGQGAALAPARFEITISDKTFSPHVLVVPAGTTVAFPNHDPFDHNVFSVSDSNSFDLGLYGRGEGKATVFRYPGLVRVFCNVHPRMVALVQVMATHHFAQASGDGSFTISGVEPGTYKLHVWHERASQEFVRDVVVGQNGVADIQVSLNARGFRWQPHKNKFGKDYPTNAGRERY